MVMLAKVFAGSVAVGGEDADELKGTQQMSKAVQQQLNRMPTSAHAAAVMTARGPAAASTAASSLGLITQLLGFISSKRASHERYRGSSEVSSAAAERWNCSHPRVNDTECRCVHYSARHDLAAVRDVKVVRAHCEPWRRSVMPHGSVGASWPGERPRLPQF
eukprot:933154-Prymnesium_polylepis.1